jgi:hypothetical protein
MMKFELTVEVSEGVADKTRLIHKLSGTLFAHFADKHYGNDVIQIYIRIICVAPEFDWFSTIRKPRYKFFGKHVRDGVEIVEDRVFSFSVKIDYETFKNQTDEENNKMLASKILGSLSNLDALPKKVKDFDKERFREDMRTFLEAQKLLS